MPARAAGRRTLERRQRSEARGRIVAAAEEALSTRRLRELSVDDVMQTAGMSRTIFYRHFDDLFDLVLTVAAGAFEELLSLQQSLLDERIEDPAALVDAMRAAVNVFAEHGPLIRAVAEGAALDEEVEVAYNRMFERVVELTARFLEERSALPHEQVPELARALTHMNVGYLLDAFGGDPRVPPEVATSTVLTTWAAIAGP
jgi:AcrR family transcriptional regulator